MKIRLLVTGKTDEEYLKNGIQEYTSRIKRYVTFETVEISVPKHPAGFSQQLQCQREAELIRKHLSPGEMIILLDERGQEMRSADFAGFLNRQFLSGGKSLVFIVGGPFGFDPSLKKAAGASLSLSKMTFSHQMVRLFFTEQLYRALTILRGESYHHE